MAEHLVVNPDRPTNSIEPLLDHVLATLAQTDLIGELGARRDDLITAIRCRHWEAVRYYVREAPLDLVPDETDCLYVRGLVLWRQERLDEAKICFEQARQFYLVVDKDQARAALCCLELADISNERGEYQTASHYLEAAQALLAEAGQSDATIAARYELIAAVVAPNVGRPCDAVTHGQSALHSFQIRGDKPAEFLALMAIVSASFQLGDYTEATSRLDQAKLCYASGLVNRRYFARILNTEAHIEWYRGNLQRATELAGELLYWTTKREETRQRVYAGLLLSNLARACGDFGEAERHYTDTRQFASETNFASFKPWVDIQTAWLHLLQGHHQRAQLSIESAMDNADAGTWAGFSVSQGVLHAQQGRYAVAEELLNGSLAFYNAAGDELSVCAIRCHLAWLHLQQRQREKAKATLAPALAWLQVRNAAYFPHWWSPTIMADLCVYAVEHLPAAQCVVRKMCVEHLSAHVRTPLAGLLSAGDPPTRARAGRILDRIEGERYTELAWVKKPAVRRVLCDLLDRGTLRRETLPELFDLLVTAEQKRTWNSTVVAVFGLYLEGCSRKEIGSELGCSVEVIRRAITHVFNVFEVDAARLPNTAKRRAAVRKAAKRAEVI